MAAEETIDEQAVAWAVRTSDPAFEDWDGFTTWLEQHPAHSRAYDRVAAAVADAAEALPVPMIASNDDQPARPARRLWLGAAMAATIAAVIGLGLWQAMPRTSVIETAPGETRIVELAGADRIELAGGTRILLDSGDPRSVTLETGQAVFAIAHDPAAPFVVVAGEDRLVDVGTVFEVKHTAAQMVLSVAEGAVAFNPERQDVIVTPGMRLASRPGSDAYHISNVPPEEVGEWREGRLTFDDQRLADIAGDLSRMSGIAYTVSPLAADQRASGSVLIEPLRRDPAALGPLLGVNVRRRGEAWEIGGR